MWAFQATAAKAALCLPVTSMKLPASEFKPCTSTFCLEEWQVIWNSAANNKLHAVYPTVDIHINLVSRHDAVIINRLKIGHSRLMHSYLLFLERTNQHVQNVTLYWQWSIYFWIVPNSGTSGLNTSVLLLWKTFLWPPCVIGQAIYIFILWFLLLSFFSSPNLSGWRLDVYHTSTHGVALVHI